MAQLVERLLCTQDVSGSSPLTSTGKKINLNISYLSNSEIQLKFSSMLGKGWKKKIELKRSDVAAPRWLSHANAGIAPVRNLENCIETRVNSNSKS